MSGRGKLANAAAMNVKLCLLTHHELARTDSSLQNLQKELRKDTRFRSVSFEFARGEVVYLASSQKATSKKSA